MDPAWIIAACALATILAGLAVWMFRGAWHLAKEFLYFVDEWRGVPAMHGRPGRPGVLDRLSAMEVTTSEISKQVHINGGNSLKDVVNRIDSKIDQTKGELQSSIDQIADQIQKFHGGQP